jgi:hypothetical protein
LPPIAADSRRNYARAKNGERPTGEKVWKRRRLTVENIRIASGRLVDFYPTQLSTNFEWQLCALVPVTEVAFIVACKQTLPATSLEVVVLPK